MSGNPKPPELWEAKPKKIQPQRRINIHIYIKCEIIIIPCSSSERKIKYKKKQ